MYQSTDLLRSHLDELSKTTSSAVGGHRERGMSWGTLMLFANLGPQGILPTVS